MGIGNMRKSAKTPSGSGATKLARSLRRYAETGTIIICLPFDTLASVCLAMCSSH